MKKSSNLFVLLFALLLSLSSMGQVVINEYSASNLAGYLDNYSKTEDWIELYNTSDTSINIGGYFLSDKESNPTKWEIPAGTTISGHGFFSFWASGRDEVSGEDYHTNFKLKQTKETPEYVVFSNSEGEIIDSHQLQITQVEHAMGRETDAADIWKIFTNPTKGSSNTTPSFDAYAAAPTMSEEAGFYADAVSISLSTSDSDSTIYYTTNGNTPTTGSSVYSSPINISSTRIVKAFCVSDNPTILPSFITFNTYFINTDHSLPVLSTSGNNMQTMLNGDDSLKPHGTIEYFEDGIRKDFGYGEYNKHGQDSWAFPQRSYDYIARDEMGYHSAIKQKLLNLSDREDFQRIIIRASGDDNYPGIDSSAHMRDIFIQKLANKNNLKLDMRRGERCVSYVNGDFWGVYSIRERVTDSDYTKYYYNQDKYNIQYLMLWGDTWAEYGGDQALTDWEELKDFILSHDMTNESDFDYVDSQYDYASLIDYVIINSFVVCTDWINWNVGWWRGLDPEGSHQKWGYILWDEDATFNHYVNYTGVPDETANAAPCYPEGISEWSDPGQHIEILNHLLENETVSQYYNARYQDLMNTVFIEDEMIDLLEGIESSIAPEMPKQIERWGGNMSEWQDNVQKIKDFISDRITVIPEGLNDCYSLTGPYNINVSVEPIGAGGIMLNSIELGNEDFTWLANYHGGMDINLKAIESNTDYAFSHWELEHHSVLPDSNTNNVTLELTQDDTIVAVFTPTTSTPKIVINEINYNSSDDFDPGDWIELYNNDTTTVDLSNWVFKDGDDAHEFIIPSGTIMLPNTYLVLTQEITDFQTLFPDITPVLGSFSFGLSGGGELIRLFDATGAMIDKVDYDDAEPWPVQADGDGPTLELTNPNYDNILASSWHSSNTTTASHGTPVALNSMVNVGLFEKEIAPFSIYPNPMEKETKISINDNIQITKGKAIIYSVLGKIVLSKEFKTNSIMLRPSKLNSGVYICKIFNESECLGSKKIIIK